ncbi:MAG: helix-turn-helix domain-containing protein [Planctomycetota bacterium]
MKTAVAHEADVDRLIPFRESARFMGVSTRTLERHIQAGRMPVPMRFGGKRMYSRSQLEEVIEKIKRGQSWR